MRAQARKRPWGLGLGGGGETSRATRSMKHLWNRAADMWRFSTVSACVLIGMMSPPSARAQDSVPWDSAKTNADSVRLCPRAMTTFDAVMCENARAQQADDSLNVTYAALVKAVRADAKAETELIKGHESDPDSAV